MTKNTIKQTFNKVKFKAAKHSPEILIGVGVVGVVTSAVMACKATLKVNDILEEAKEKVDTIHEVAEKEEMTEKYTEQDMKKDLTTVYIQTGLKLTKLYAPSVILGGLSVASIIASNNISRTRNAALAAAYKTIDNSYKGYRERVAERFGEEVEREIKYDIKAVEVEETEVDKKGKEKKVKKTYKVAGYDNISDYARFFDETCPDFKKDPEMNLMFLKAQERYANDLLRINGRLFLNDVYKMLGMEPTKAGQVMGWVYDGDSKNPVFNNHVDFGIYDLYKAANRRFVNGHERAILLDFNIDGNVWETM